MPSSLATSASVDLEDGVSGVCEDGGGGFVPVAMGLDSVVVEDRAFDRGAGPVAGVGGVSVGKGDSDLFVGDHGGSVA